MEGFRFVDGEFVNTGFACECGREHTVPIQEILIRSGAIHEIGEVLKRLDIGKQGMVIADLNTYEAAGDRVVEVLQTSGHTTKLCLFNTRDIVKPDEYALGKLLLEIDPETSFLVGVGSGCLTDLTRYVSSRTKRPYISVATAASMDGYASSVAPMLQGGYKKTVLATYPQAIIADLDVLCQAPYVMTTAGFSDLLGKLNSRVDWKLSQIITGEYYCDYIVELVDHSVKTCIKHADGIRQLKPEALAGLTEGLILSGIGMLAVGHSRPASGSEHHLSHYWEMKALFENHPQHLHGTKVGVATGIMAKFYHKFFSGNPLNIDFSALERRKRSLNEWQEHVRKYFGPVAEDVITMGTPLYVNWEEQKHCIEQIQTCWEQLRELQELVPTFEHILELQNTVQGSIMPQDIDVDCNFLRETLLNAKDVRNRYTVLRAADTLGWLEEITDDVVREYED